jgi:hypothetical protein
MRLLPRWLSPEQRAQFEAGSFFDVVSCRKGVWYGATSCSPKK